MWFIHHVSENLILNQGCSQKYNYNENIHVDNNKIRNYAREKEDGITVYNEDGKDEFSVSCSRLYW